MRVKDELRQWITKMSSSNSFCEGPYISNGATSEGGPLNAKQIFRPSRNDKLTLVQQVGAMIQDHYGKELWFYFSMGPSTSIYTNAVKRWMKQNPDWRALLQMPNLYNTKRHLTKLGLTNLIPKLTDGGQEGNQFVRIFKNSGWDFLGVNMWQLLVSACLLGNTDLHPKNASNVSRSLLTALLAQSPRCLTLSGRIPILDFNSVTGNYEYLVINNEKRPDFLLRPTHDPAFFESGNLSMCPGGEDGLLPEDCVHCCMLENASRLLYCNKWEVPASFLEGNWNLVPGYPYALHKQGGGEGVVYIVPNKSIEITLVENGTEIHSSLSPSSDWEACIKEEGFIIIPMIFRPCAAVWGPTKESVGLILPQDLDDGALNSNFNKELRFYSVGFDEDAEPSDMTALEVIKNIVKIGTELFIKPGCEAWEELRGRFPGNILPADIPRMAVRVRLNIPEVMMPDASKLHVSVLTQKGVGNNKVLGGFIMLVNPWDLTTRGSALFKEKNWKVLRAVLPAPRQP